MMTIWSFSRILLTETKNVKGELNCSPFFVYPNIADSSNSLANILSIAGNGFDDPPVGDFAGLVKPALPELDNAPPEPPFDAAAT